jgi:hypothetical protein
MLKVAKIGANDHSANRESGEEGFLAAADEPFREAMSFCDADVDVEAFIERSSGFFSVDLFTVPAPDLGFCCMARPRVTARGRIGVFFAAVDGPPLESLVFSEADVNIFLDCRANFGPSDCACTGAGDCACARAGDCSFDADDLCECDCAGRGDGLCECDRAGRGDGLCECDCAGRGDGLCECDCAGRGDGLCDGDLFSEFSAKAAFSEAA